MGSSPLSEVVYEGDVIIAEFNPDNLEQLERELREKLDVGPDEMLYVTMPDDSRIEVKTLTRVDR